MMPEALLPLIALCAAVLCYIGIIRTPLTVSRALLLSFAWGFFPFSILQPATAADALLAALSYAALFFCFWAFLNLNRTSLRIRILREIYETGGEVAPARLVRLYEPGAAFRTRMLRLSSGGEVTVIAGRVRLARKRLSRAAAIIRLLRRMILGTSYRAR